MAHDWCGEATPERIAENTAMLDRLETLLDARSALWVPHWTALEQRMNAERAMGRFDEADRMHKRFAAITARRVNPEYAEIRARIDREADAMRKPVTLDAIASFISSDIIASVPLVHGADFSDARAREAVEGTMQAAE